jgi:hypothetical protein
MSKAKRAFDLGQSEPHSYNQHPCARVVGAPPEAPTIRRGEGGPTVGLSKEPIPPLAGSRYRLDVESSADFKRWTAAGELERDTSGALAVPTGGEGAHRFFRLRPSVELTD